MHVLLSIYSIINPDAVAKNRRRQWTGNKELIKCWPYQCAASHRLEPFSPVTPVIEMVISAAHTQR